MAAERSSFGIAARFVVLGGIVLAVLAFVFLGNRGGNQASAAQLTQDNAAVFKDKDKLLVSINLGNPDKTELRGVLTVQLLGPDKKPIAKATKPVQQREPAASYRFELPLTKHDLKSLTLKGEFGDQKFEVPLEDVLLAKAHETSISASPELYSNSVAAIRCGVHGCKSYTDTIPLAGAEVAIELKTAEGKVIPLHQGKTEANGEAVARFQVPDLKPGQYTMIVATKSTLGEEKLERKIKVKAEPKIMLVTDKPLYQPGQLIHIRALSLKPMDLSPAGNADVVFEVEDARGNKVFKKARKTSEFGIAAVDFQLADEINMGDYQIRALMGTHEAHKTVTVKKYVLPKFKVGVKSDKPYYLPKETIEAELQSDYFFGKPVAEGVVKVSASTFDVQFKQFQTWEGKTNESGHAKFEIKLPDYFVGQPLAKGNALVKLEIKVTDSADHTETITKTFPVSSQPISISLIPEGGRLVPGVENRIFAAAIYPDGSPAKCDVQLWLGQQEQGKPFARLATNEAGLAEFKLTPKADQFRNGGYEQKQIDMLGGKTIQIGGQKQLFDLYAVARDAKGNEAKTRAQVNGDAFGDNVLLRLDKAIYKGGDTVRAEIHTTAGLPTAYLDFVRGGQILMSRWFDVKEGKAATTLDLPASVFGTVEVHAYQMLNTGEIIRDSRVVYIQPPDGLKIDVKASKREYRPGEKGTIRFQVTDAAGKPTPAALGVIIVDEAVYALQDMQPGLEKVYFTLQEELMKPRVQAVYRPQHTIGELVREPVLADSKQQIAEVLLTSVQPKMPQRWELDPSVERRQKIEGQLRGLGQQMFNWASSNHEFMKYDDASKQWAFTPDLLPAVVKQYGIDPAALKDPFGAELDLNKLARLEPEFTVDSLARAVTLQRMQNIYWNIVNYTNEGKNRARFFKNSKWSLPETLVQRIKMERRIADPWDKDAWGESFRLIKLDKKQNHQTGQTQFDFHQLVSAGPDRQFGTKDDVEMANPNEAQWVHFWWLESATRMGWAQQGQHGRLRGQRFFMMDQLKRNRMLEDRAIAEPTLAPAQFAAQGGGEKFAAAAPQVIGDSAAGNKADPLRAGALKTESAAPILRVRDYFPETMLWKPSLITDDKGVVELPVDFADSITTWRLSASASARGGLLGGTNAPLKVFQDFFVDLDLPVSLTQNDEVSFPVAVYNYLETPQTVTIELQQEEWFELVDGAGLKRTLDLKAKEVTSIKFRIRANKIGQRPLLVKAVGSKMSDAIRRVIEVAPDGKKIDIVATDRLTGHVAHTIDIPASAIADSQKLYVKIYPGVFSQVLEGTEGMLRMPHGCFEQTSSSAYPNILVANYIKSARVANAQKILMKAEQYLNAGYQRLLTFERPGGGFDWWGNGTPLVWLSAYGLQEFNDMSKVWPVDRGVINRTQAFLMKNQNADGSWDKIGATHGETITRMGDAKLLLTSYVVWSLLDSGMTVKEEPRLQKAVDYILNHVDDAKGNAYVTALAANALAAWDAKDDRTYAVLQKLDKMQKDVPEWKAACFRVAGGQTLTYARGDSVTIETTALAALAMLRSGQFTNSVNKSLTYLIKSKSGNGTWGSTAATILSLKALIAGAGGAKQNGAASFTILVNGKAVKEGKITPENADVMQMFELDAQPGRNDVEIKVEGNANSMYQIVGRYYDSWSNVPQPKKPTFDVSVAYDRTELTTKDLLRAKATMKYLGAVPTYMVILDLGIPPGFSVDPGDFAEMVGAKKVQKFSITSRQVTLYIGDVTPGQEMNFEYTLKPKYPIKAKTPATVAYEYNTPANRGAAKPVEIKVDQK